MGFTLASLPHYLRAFLGRDPALAVLEVPAEGAAVGDRLTVSGWTMGRHTEIAAIDVDLDGSRLGSATYGLPRPDVALAFPDNPQAPRAGFHFVAILPPHIRGLRTIVVRIRDARGVCSEHRRVVTVRGRSARASKRARPEAAIDRARIVESALVLEGYAWWPRSAPPLAVTVSREGKVYGTAIATLSRPDLVDRFGDYDAIRCGFRVVTEAPRITAAVTPVSFTIDVADATRRSARFASAVALPRHADEMPAAGARRPLASVSIVIPVHGALHHTEACLRQLHSTIPADAGVEIVVVDDASKDRTATVLAEWTRKDPRVRVLTNDANEGFGESCNRGARAARNELLVFLNNDTLPRAGWLEALARTFDDPSVGAAGSKLVYPDGTLQEAGGVVFADGNGWNFGRGADAGDPLFNFVRDVDYCSAAALATRRSLFEAIGGFDKRFAPAYYEDTDYCFAVRAAGCRVVFQPASVVVHVEGGTAGVDETAGVKRGQAKNRAVFVDKWKTVLNEHRPAPHALDRSAWCEHLIRDPRTRRVLVWAPTLPEWDRESGSKRVFDILMMLRDRGCAVSFIAEAAESDERYVHALQQSGITVYAGSETRWAGSEFLPDATELLTWGRFDLALLHFWWIAERHVAEVRRLSPRTKVIVDSVDLHFVRESRNPRAAEAVRHDEKRRELAVYTSADAVLTVSGTEAAALAAATGGHVHADVVADAERSPGSRAPFEQRGGVLFLGNFRHAPNVAALRSLLSDIVPQMRPALLSLHPVLIVGTDLTDALVEACGPKWPDVKPVGWVPSIEPYLREARVMVVPLTYGAGTKRKLVQAAMFGLPAVSTSVGIEGLPLTPGRDVLVANDTDSFVEAVERLLVDQMLWEQIAENAANAIRAAHDPAIVRRQFDDVIDRLLT